MVVEDVAMMNDNEPDDIRMWDHDERSPYYREVEEEVSPPVYDREEEGE